ncbi:MAG: type II toxin-antitoxin system HicB family antitoxin [bacterium]
MKIQEYKVVIQKNEENDGYWAYCPDLPGCNSIGENLAEIKANIKEAIQGYIEVMVSMKKSIPAPQSDTVFLEKIAVSI